MYAFAQEYASGRRRAWVFTSDPQCTALSLREPASEYVGKEAGMGNGNIESA